ncbi:uncharacterized protein LOC127250354 isoform X2 [Andrographis paniculata]|uniref:uncharacterized protein LOC127250354 isoform X2 n=1 Tax=Andrographis paniculata TaxID=175694 RepID=UPI0021E714B9|nr:uncharacterized protein LOC127250354 isoform X2 [Andrographis paniculata]
MDPLPNMNKAYSLFLQVEKQREIHITKEQSAFMIINRNTASKKTTYKKQAQVEKKNQICDHCKRKGHSKESCFQLHGTPDWYKEIVEKRMMVGCDVYKQKQDTTELKQTHLDISAMIKAELQKLLLSHSNADSPVELSNAAIEFSGPIL